MLYRCAFYAIGLFLAATAGLAAEGDSGTLDLYTKCVTLTPDYPSATIAVDSADATAHEWEAACLNRRLTLTPASGTTGETALTISAGHVRRPGCAEVLLSNGEDATDVSAVRVTLAGGRYAGVWQALFGGDDEETGNDVAPASDGGFFIAGPSCPHGSASGDLVVVKTDARGALLWRCVVGQVATGSVIRLCETPDGGCVTKGDFGDKAVGTGLTRLDSSGNIVWHYTYEGLYGILHIEPYAGGGYVFLLIDGQLAKIDEAGLLEWQMDLIGEGDWSGNYRMAQAGDGGFVGVTWPFTIRKVNAAGEPVWETIIEESMCEPRAVVRLADGGFAAAVRKHEFLETQGLDRFVTHFARLDENGNVLSSQYFCPGFRSEEVTSMCATSDGHVMMVGVTTHIQKQVYIKASSFDIDELFPNLFRTFVRKTDLDGHVEWKKIILGAEPNAITPTDDGGAVVLCTFDDILGGTDFYVVKIAGDGTVLPTPMGLKADYVLDTSDEAKQDE